MKTKENETLTPTENLYLDALKADPKGVSVEVLAAATVSPIRASNLVAVHMKNLRRKLAGKVEIECVRGFGYRIAKKV